MGNTFIVAIGSWISAQVVVVLYGRSCLGSGGPLDSRGCLSELAFLPFFGGRFIF